MTYTMIVECHVTIVPAAGMLDTPVVQAGPFAPGPLVVK